MNMLYKICIASGIAVVLGVVAPLALAGGNEPAESGHTLADKSRHVVELAVSGMVSDACPTVVKAVLRDVPGVIAVSANHEESRATVTYDPTKITPEEVAEKLRKGSGFGVEIVKVRTEQSTAAFTELCGVTIEEEAGAGTAAHSCTEVASR